MLQKPRSRVLWTATHGTRAMLAYSGAPPLPGEEEGGGVEGPTALHKQYHGDIRCLQWAPWGHELYLTQPTINKLGPRRGGLWHACFRELQVRSSTRQNMACVPCEPVDEPYQGEIRVHACTHRPPTRGGERCGARLNCLFDFPRPFTTCQCVCLTETCSPCVGCPTVFLASRRSADTGWVHNM